jgi:hypothetical protein
VRVHNIKERRARPAAGARASPILALKPDTRGLDPRESSLGPMPKSRK